MSDMGVDAVYFEQCVILWCMSQLIGVVFAAWITRLSDQAEDKSL